MGDSRDRVRALDRLRGLLVLLMALDHANYFVAQRHSSGEYWGGPFPAYPSAGAFLSRLVTHPAAPGFFFLMGAGMALFEFRRADAGWKPRRIRGHLLLRGVVLIALQLLVVNRAWELSPGAWSLTVYIGVLAALGGAMITAAWLVEARAVFLLIPAALLLIGIELLTPSPHRWGSGFHPLLRLLFIPGGTRALWVNYPLLPWLGVTFYGLAFGEWLRKAPDKAMRRSLWIGIGALLLFPVLRLGGGFGNIRPQSSGGWIGFLNVVKYPPSLTFLLLTMGFNLIVLRFFYLFEGQSSTWDPLLVFGGSPLFFYLTHLFLYAGMGRLFTPGGTSLPGMLLYWLLGLALLYPACLGFGIWKRRQSSGSLLRLL
ncbi:MAG: DUF1624 domain-containing protein [Spirochaetaceae bacterium]|nr:MAG: DUF1624 domain-containing protein [Spirochaetaceae bacterium]